MKLILDDGRRINVTLSDDELTKLCKKENLMWFPEDGEEAWYIHADDVELATSWSKDNEHDMFRLKLGHIFKTKEEAKKYLALIEAKYVVRNRIAELNDGWIPHWSDLKQHKYFINIYENKLEIGIKIITKYQPNWMYLKSEKLAKQLIEELEPELRIILEE